MAAWQQCGYWRDSEALWKRNLSFPQYENLVAHYNLGLALAEKGRYREATEQYIAGLSVGPKDEVCRINLGIAYEALGMPTPPLSNTAS